MREPGTVAAFDRAEARFMALINRASLNLTFEQDTRSIDPESADLYRFMVQETLLTAGHLVNWCYEQGYLTRTEAFNIKHWLYWFAEPDLFNYCEGGMDFRYEN